MPVRCQALQSAQDKQDLCCHRRHQPAKETTNKAQVNTFRSWEREKKINKRAVVRDYLGLLWLEWSGEPSRKADISFSKEPDNEKEPAVHCSVGKNFPDLETSLFPEPLPQV